MGCKIIQVLFALVFVAIPAIKIAVISDIQS